MRPAAIRRVYCNPHIFMCFFLINFKYLHLIARSVSRVNLFLGLYLLLSLLVTPPATKFLALSHKVFMLSQQPTSAQLSNKFKVFSLVNSFIRCFKLTHHVFDSLLIYYCPLLTSNHCNPAPSYSFCALKYTF